jgi:hypothetical protein
MQITFKSYLKLTGFGSILIPSINNTLWIKDSLNF